MDQEWRRDHKVFEERSEADPKSLLIYIDESHLCEAGIILLASYSNSVVILIYCASQNNFPSLKLKKLQ